MSALFQNLASAAKLFTTVTTEGLVPDTYKVSNQPADDYHAMVDVQSCSMLKYMLDSPAAYMHQLMRRKSSTSKSKEFGTLVHTLCLEPHKFFSEVAVYPGEKQPHDKDFAEFQKSRPGLYIIDEPTHNLAKQAVERLKNQVVMGRKFGDYVAEGEAEASIYYTDPTVGVRCRTRVDLLHPEAIFDLKTTAYAQTAAWVRHALSLNYDMQSYMYSLAECLFSGRTIALPFVFMTVENTEPLSTAARRAGQTFLEEGARKYQHAMTAYKACLDTDTWPCPGGEEVIELAHWQVSHLDRSWASLSALS
jgi:hypothetical protein